MSKLSLTKPPKKRLKTSSNHRSGSGGSSTTLDAFLCKVPCFNSLLQSSPSKESTRKPLAPLSTPLTEASESTKPSREPSHPSASSLPLSNAPPDPIQDEDINLDAPDESDGCQLDYPRKPLIDPCLNTHRSVPLQILSMKLRARPPLFPLPSCLSKASGKRFSRRVRCALRSPRGSQPAVSVSRRPEAVCGMSLSVDGMLLAVAWADGRVSVYHADDVECNDSKVPFKGSSPMTPNANSPLEPVATFKQFSQSRTISTLTWHPYCKDRDVLFVTYERSLAVTVIDWNSFMDGPLEVPVPFLAARGVRPIPHQTRTNFTQDTVTSLAVLPAGTRLCKHCESNGKKRFPSLLVGTARGLLLCYCTGPHKASEAAPFAFKQKLDKKLSESLSSTRAPAASPSSASITAIVPFTDSFATTSLTGQINLYSLTESTSALMSSTKQPAVLATFDVRSYLSSASYVGFGVAGAFEVRGGWLGVMLENGEMLRLGLRSEAGRKKGQHVSHQLELQARITHKYVSACVVTNGRGDVLDRRYSESLNVGVGIGGGAFAKVKPYYPVRTEEVTARLRAEMNGPISEFTFGETEHLRVRDEMERELVYKVELVRGWQGGALEADCTFKKLGERPTALTSICDGRYVVVGDREGILQIYG